MSKGKSRWFKEKSLSEKPSKLQWGILIITLVIIYFTMFYTDNFGMFLTYYWLNEGLFDGKGLSAIASAQMPYGIIHQWICELWVLPVNIFYHLFGFHFDGTIALLWYKMCPIFFAALSIKEIGQIANSCDIKEEKVQWLQFFILSTLLFALPVFHIAQTDSLYMFFALKGLNALIKEDISKFVLWFALAIPLKLIAVFLFFPLVFLSQKKIWKIVQMLVCGCILLPIQKILYKVVDFCNQRFINTGTTGLIQENVTETTEKTSQGLINHFYNKALYFEFPAVRKGLVASALIFFFALFFIWCYMQKKENEVQWRKLCVYVSVVSLLLFFVMASPSPYWIVILFPFLFLMIFLNEEKFRLNMVLQIVFTLTMFFVYVIDTYWVYGGSMTFDWLLLSKLGIVPGNHVFQEPPHIAGYLANLGLDQFMPIVTACCLAATVGLVWVNHPKASYKEHLNEKEQLGLLHGFAWFSLLCLVGWYIMNVICLGRY